MFKVQISDHVDVLDVFLQFSMQQADFTIVDGDNILKLFDLDTCKSRDIL